MTKASSLKTKKTASVKKAKELGANKFGWAGFKHNLMKYLGIPESEFYKFDVPLEWKNACLKANGRPEVKE